MSRQDVSMPPGVRPRVDGDIAAVIEILAEVHRLDGYPTYWPVHPVAFIAPDYELDAWVAHVSGAIAGHVALHDAGHDPALRLAMGESRLSVDQLVSVGRLFSSRTFRGSGVGACLVGAAVEAANARGLRPFLSVVRALRPAVELYERLGWSNVGSLTIEVNDGVGLDSLVFLGPTTD